MLFYGYPTIAAYVLQQCESAVFDIVHAAGQSCFGERATRCSGQQPFAQHWPGREQRFLSSIAFYVLTNGVPVVTEMAAGEQRTRRRAGACDRGYGGLAQRCEALVRRGQT